MATRKGGVGPKVFIESATERDAIARRAGPDTGGNVSQRSVNRTNADISEIIEEQMSNNNKKRKSLGKREIKVEAWQINEFRQKNMPDFGLAKF